MLLILDSALPIWLSVLASESLADIGKRLVRPPNGGRGPMLQTLNFLNLLNNPSTL